MMIVVLALVTALAVVVFFAVVLWFVYNIALQLESIGGKGDSYLAKLRLGLRAIEGETSHIPTEVTKLNEGLTAVAGGLVSVDGHLVKTIEAAVQQEDYVK